MRTWVAVLAHLAGTLSVGHGQTTKPKPAALIDQFLAQHGTVLEEDQVFYRWQSTASGESLVAKGVMTDAVNTYFMNKTVDVSAGPGLYVAGSPLSSQSYLPAEGGNLIEVRIKKGTRVLDLTEANQVAARRTAGLSMEDFENAAGAGRPLLLRYNGDWHVGKHLTNHAEFRMYPGPDQTPAEVANVFTKAFPLARNQIAAQIARVRPELIAHLPRSGEYSAALLRVLPESEVASLLARTLGTRQTTSVTETLLTVIANDAKLSQLVTGHPDLIEKAAATFRVFHGESQDARTFSFLSRLARAAPDISTNREGLKELVMHQLMDHRLERRWPEIADRVTPLLERVHFTASEQRVIAARLRQLVNGAPDFEAPFEAIAQISRAAHLDDADLRTDFDALVTRVRRVRRARETGAVADVRAVLSDAKNIGSMHRLLRHLHGAVPDHAIDAAVGGIVRDAPAVFKRLLDTPDAHQFVAANAGEGFGAAFDQVYASALDGGPDVRYAFLRGCLNSEACARRLDRAATADRGLIFRGVRELGQIAYDLRTLGYDDRARAQRLTKLLIGAVDDPAALASFARQMNYHGADAAERLAGIMTSARRIGLRNFRARQLLDLDRVVLGDKRVTRELILQAAQNAANAQEIREVAFAARQAGVETQWLRKDLTRRFQAYAPLANDVDSVGESGLNLGRPRVTPAGDCVTGLAQLLGQR